jgi:hypothetical protein
MPIEKAVIRRKESAGKSSALPSDYLQMVEEVFSSNFSDTLDKLSTDTPARFVAGGDVFADEVVVSLSLLKEGKLSGLSLFASSDFDPKASAPTIETLLSVCVDGIGQVFQGLFEIAEKKDALASLLDLNLADLPELPLMWTQIEVEKRKLFVRVDRSNPVLDQAADDWLAKHDPEQAKESRSEDQEAEKLFVVGPKTPSSKTKH